MKILKAQAVSQRRAIILPSQKVLKPSLKATLMLIKAWSAARAGPYLEG